MPHVVYYKPTGNVNQHPGYANADDGDAHIADLVTKLKAGAQWAHMVIVITYDEYGGQWDHVAPPKGDKYGPGTRIPALIISPYSKAGTVDHTQYDTARARKPRSKTACASPPYRHARARGSFDAGNSYRQVIAFIRYASAHIRHYLGS